MLLLHVLLSYACEAAELASFLFYFISFLFFIFFLGRLLVPYFSLVAPVVCYLFFLHVVLYVFLANK